jgi:ketosteroid isomerase-like protein
MITKTHGDAGSPVTHIDDDGRRPEEASDMPRAIDTVIALFDALADFDHSAIAATLHEDLRFEMPFEPGAPVLDKAGLQQMLLVVTTSFQRFRLNVVETIEGADPARVVARYKGDCLSMDGSVSYQNDYIGAFTVADGQIAEVREYANPMISARMYEELAAVQQA